MKQILIVVNSWHRVMTGGDYHIFRVAQYLESRPQDKLSTASVGIFFSERTAGRRRRRPRFPFGERDFQYIDGDSALLCPDVQGDSVPPARNKVRHHRRV